MKKLFVLFFVLPVCHAKGEIKQETDISIGGGLSTLNYTLLDNMHVYKGLGGEGAFHYTLLFNQSWGAGMGIGTALYSANAVVSGMTVDYPGQDIPGTSEKYTLRTTFHRYEERQNMTALIIPLYAQYETGNDIRFYARMGGKLSFPLSTTFSVENAHFNNTGYTEFNPDPLTQTEWGLTEYKNVNNNGKLPLNLSLSVRIESGVKIKIPTPERLWLYTNQKMEYLSFYIGAYCDYGLLDMHASNKESMVITPINPQFNSVLQSKNGQGIPLTGSVRPLSAGVVLRFAMQIRYKSQSIMFPLREKDTYNVKWKRPTKVMVYDEQGQLFEELNGTAELSILRSKWKSGIYFLEWGGHSKKIVIKD